MTKRIFTTLAVALFSHTLAHAAPASDNGEIDRTQEVAYTCKVKVDNKLQDQKITAMYGIKGNDVIVAQLKIDGTITPGMWRDNFVIMNRFISQDATSKTTVWTTFPADASQLTKVDGGTFSVADNTGAQQSIVFNKCKLDAVATAKLAH